mmetsp:Transcript_55977/g.131206  ORF Transcript_55977/g.131206 Transcript_55977/m.131206 type:complete len:213 (-) Transcript_55977:1003-1641(-)
MVAVIASVWALISPRMSRRRRSVISISWWASWLASIFLSSTASSPSSSFPSDAHSWMAACSASILCSTPSRSALWDASLASRSSSSERLCWLSELWFFCSASMRAFSSARSCSSLRCSSSSSIRPYVSTSSFSCTTCSSASTLPRYLCMWESMRSEVASLPITSSSSPLNTSATSLPSFCSRVRSSSSSCLLRLEAASLAFRSAFFAWRLSR